MTPFKHLALWFFNRHATNNKTEHCMTAIIFKGAGETAENCKIKSFTFKFTV